VGRGSLFLSNPHRVPEESRETRDKDLRRLPIPRDKPFRGTDCKGYHKDSRPGNPERNEILEREREVSGDLINARPNT